MRILSNFPFSWSAEEPCQIHSNWMPGLKEAQCVESSVGWPCKFGTT